MPFNTLQQLRPLLGIWKPAFFLISVLITAVIVSLRSEMIALLFEAIVLVLVLALSRAQVPNLVIAFVITDHLCQFLKRFIFLWGVQSRPFYYLMQLLPDLIVLLAFILVFRAVTRRRLPQSTKLLMAYSCVSILVSLLNVRALNAGTALVGLHEAFFPVATIAIGSTLSANILGRIARIFCFLIPISVVYGVYQFIVGPTLIDQAWATATHEYSMEAGKVWDAMTVTGADFRAYSYYADHTTWGLFLVIAITVVIMSIGREELPKKWLYFLGPCTFVGLVVCETRTAWLALLGSVIVHQLITTRILRRPMLLIVGVISSFAIVVTLGDYAVHHVNFGVFSNALASRYATVGTIDARTSAWRLFVKNLPSRWLIGLGAGYGNGDANISMSDEVFSHNMYVELLVSTGLPGLFLFLGFFYTWIKETFWVARVGGVAASKSALWAVSLAVGMLITGSFQGMNFMNLYMCLILGLMSGEWIRLHEQFAQRTVSVPQFARPLFQPGIAFQK